MANRAVIERLRKMIREIEEASSQETRLQHAWPGTHNLPGYDMVRSYPAPISSEWSRDGGFNHLHLVYPKGWAEAFNPPCPSSEEALRSLEPKLHAPTGWLFLDIETTGLLGAGTIAFLVGFGAWTPSGFELTQFLLGRDDDEESMLASVAKLMSQHKTLVTFNGKSFDVPMLESRSVILGFPPLPTPDVHLDLYHLVRNMGRKGTYGLGLKDSCERFLDITRKQDIPGNLIPALYFVYCREGDISILEPVIEHNRMDILDMVLLANRLAKVLAGEQGVADDRAALRGAGRLHYRKGNLSLARRCLEQASDNRLLPWETQPPDEAVKSKSLLADVMRKQGDWDNARTIWEDAVGRGIATNWDYLWLARYYELVRDDVGTAIRLVEEAIKISSARQEPILAELSSRHRRLLGVLNRRAKGR